MILIIEESVQFVKAEKVTMCSCNGDFLVEKLILWKCLIDFYSFDEGTD